MKLDYQVLSLIHWIEIKTIPKWKTYYHRIFNFDTNIRIYEDDD